MNPLKQIQSNKKQNKRYKTIIEQLNIESEVLFFSLLDKICNDYNIKCKIEYSSITYKQTMQIIQNNKHFINKHNRKYTQTIYDNKEYRFTLTGKLNKQEITKIQKDTNTILYDTIQYNYYYDYHFREKKIDNFGIW